MDHSGTVRVRTFARRQREGEAVTILPCATIEVLDTRKTCFDRFDFFRVGTVGVDERKLVAVFSKLRGKGALAIVAHFNLDRLDRAVIRDAVQDKLVLVIFGHTCVGCTRHSTVVCRLNLVHEELIRMVTRLRECDVAKRGRLVGIVAVNSYRCAVFNSILDNNLAGINSSARRFIRHVGLEHKAELVVFKPCVIRTAGEALFNIQVR